MFQKGQILRYVGERVDWIVSKPTFHSNTHTTEKGHLFRFIGFYRSEFYGDKYISISTLDGICLIEGLRPSMFEGL